MARRLLISILASILVLSSFGDDTQDKIPDVYDQGLIYPYGIVSYKNMILVSNYGVDDLNGEPHEGKGFVSAIQGGVVKTFIRPDGHLLAPKGMAIYEDQLFIADVGKIVVYNLKKIVSPPTEIKFPEQEQTLTDIVIIGDMLVVSVNNTGRIYGLDLRNTSKISKSEAILLAELPGAGAMAVHGTKLYVNSFQSEISESSLMYVGDLTSQSEESPFHPFMEGMTPGQYLGVTISDEYDKIYISAMKTDEFYSPVLYNCSASVVEKPRFFDTGFKIASPTSILVKGNNLWIIDHVESCVYRYTIVNPEL